jgi:hypothetical protein
MIESALPSRIAVCEEAKRLESRKMSYLGAALSFFLFVPLGFFICIWAVVSLRHTIVREAFKMRELTNGCDQTE